MRRRLGISATMATVHHWGAFRRRLSTPGDFVRQVAVLAGGTALGQAAMLLATPALTRLYSREEIGMIGMLNSYVGIALVAVALSYEAAIVMADDDAEAARLLIVSLGISVGGSVLAGFALAAAALVPSLGLQWLPPWAPYAIVPMVVLAAATAIGRSYLIRFHEYRTVAGVVAAQSAARAVAPLALAFTQAGLGALVGGEIVGRAVGVGRTCAAVWRRLRASLTVLRLHSLLASIRKYRKYPLIFLPSSLINVLASQLPVPIVGVRYGLEAAGYVALSQLLLSAPIGLISTSVADVFYVRAAEYARTDPAKLVPLIRSTAGGLLRLGWAPALLGMFVVVPSAGFVFGKEWTIAGQVLAAMIPMTLAATVVSPISRMVLVAHRQEVKLLYDVCALCSVVGALYGGSALGWSLTASVSAMSGMMVLCYGVYYALILLLARRMAASLPESQPQT